MNSDIVLPVFGMDSGKMYDIVKNGDFFYENNTYSTCSCGTPE